MHRRANSEVRRSADFRSSDFNDISDLSDPEYFELDGMRTGHSFETIPNNDDLLLEKPVGESYFKPVYVRAFVSLALWYAFSIGLSVYNKFLFSDSGLDFRFPVLTTAIHQLTQLVLALLALWILRIATTHAFNDNKLKVLPAGLASATDIGLANSSLMIVTLSFYTMIKSTALGFVLLFSVVFGLENPTWRLATIIGVMTIGVFLMVAGEADFNIIGFFLVLGASCSSGLRWALIKLLLNGDKDESAKHHHPKLPLKPHPVQTILALSPIMFFALLIWGLILEGPVNFVSASLWKENSVAVGLGYIIFPGLLAFAMTWAEFELLNATGPLTLAVAGICKEVATIVVSVFTFHDKLSIVNCVGLAVTLTSIVMYNIHRAS